MQQQELSYVLEELGRARRTCRAITESHLRTTGTPTADEWLEAPRPSLARLLELASVESRRGNVHASAPVHRGAARRCEDCGFPTESQRQCWTCPNCGRTDGGCA